MSDEPDIPAESIMDFYRPKNGGVPCELTYNYNSKLNNKLFISIRVKIFWKKLLIIFLF